MTISELNDGGDGAAVRRWLLQCCASRAWAERVLSDRPYEDRQALFQSAERNWTGLKEEDYLEAFAGHPKIGDLDSLKSQYAETKALASGEQSAVVEETDEEVLRALQQANQTYEERFGFIFIVCATGKTAAEMLQILQKRLANTRQEELMNAAEEQRKIMLIRLEKVL